MKILIALGALASIGQFILFAITAWRSYKTDMPLESVWEKHPHEGKKEK